MPRGPSRLDSSVRETYGDGVRVFGSAPGVGGRRLVVALAMLALASAALIAFSADRPARAAFPGQNGRIAFDSNRDGDFEIFRINADRTGERQLTHNDETDYGAAVSADGKRIAFFSERDGNGEVYVMRADGTHERNVSKNDAEDNEPFFTPNGKRIVFQSDRDDNAYDIYSMRLDGTGVRRLTEDPLGDGAPTVAADGRIIWVRDRSSGSCGRDGTRERPITEGHDDNYPNVSPNGKRIVFERRPEGDIYREIFSKRIAGGPARRLTRNDDADFAPVFSPDGERIAWDGGPLGDVRVMRTDGTHKHRVTLSPSVDEYADWDESPSDLIRGRESCHGLDSPREIAPRDDVLRPAKAEGEARDVRLAPHEVPVGGVARRPA